ncbi:MAG TPA: nuclear transport factor 2 family protein, partial [Sphingobacteriaceae bacterium]
MKKLLLSVALLLIAGSGFSQTGADDTEIKKAIQTMFDGMRQGDSTMIRSVLAPRMILQTIVSRGERDEVRSEPVDNFLKAVATPHDKVWDERITFDALHIDGGLASVWTSYKFYLGKDF